jgi:hypothetical protein
VVRAGIHRAARLAQGRGARLSAGRWGHGAQLARARPDFVYLSRVHPRDSARRLGDPLAPTRLLESLADAVWWRPGPDGNPEAALFAVHKEAR